MIKIVYKFADGTTSEVEVDDELGLEIQAMDRAEASADRKERRHCPLSLDRAKYEGMEFADPNTREKQEELDESQAKVEAFKATLTPIQLRRLEMLEDGMSEREIARIENTNFKSVHESIQQVRKKYLKFFN